MTIVRSGNTPDVSKANLPIISAIIAIETSITIVTVVETIIFESETESN